MDLQHIIKKYQDRNKRRLKTIKEGKSDKIHCTLLNLYIETEQIIKDLKQLL